MSIRRAPSIGYDHGPKRQYRRRVWATLGTESDENAPLAECHALLMPSSEGDEIEVALANGFREDHLHVVDRNPAIVATLKRRFPYIHTYGVTLDRAVHRLRATGVRLACANFDLTSCLSESFVAEWIALARTAPMTPGYAVAVTVQKGREAAPVFAEIASQKRVADALPEWAADDHWASGERLDLLAVLWAHARMDRPTGEPPEGVLWKWKETYKTHRVPMQYGVFIGVPTAELHGRSGRGRSGQFCAATLPPRWVQLLENTTGVTASERARRSRLPRRVELGDRDFGHGRRPTFAYVWDQETPT